MVQMILIEEPNPNDFKEVKQIIVLKILISQTMNDRLSL